MESNKGRKAFLIGFSYEGNKKLPGISIDLYKVYSFLIKYGWQDEEIKILTDVVKDDSTDVLRDAILKNIVNADVLTFIEDTKEKGQYTLFKAHNYYNNFSNFFTPASYYFVYYTGHCKDGNIILPNNSLLSLNLFKSYLIGESTLCIMDCCEAGIKLPFILHEKVYRCDGELKISDFTKNKIICISSSLENEKSITSGTGSFFTRCLFSILEDSSLSLATILQRVRKELSFIVSSYMNNKQIQTATVCVSHPHLSCLPGFLYSFPTFFLSLHPSHLVLEI